MTTAQTTAGAINGIDVTMYLVKDMKRAISFYRDALGYLYKERGVKFRDDGDVFETPVCFMPSVRTVKRTRLCCTSVSDIPENGDFGTQRNVGGVRTFDRYRPPTMASSAAA